MNKNEITNYIADSNYRHLPQEVFEKYGWIVLATPVLMHIIDKTYDMVMAQLIMQNEYELSTNPKTSDVSLKKMIILNS